MEPTKVMGRRILAYFIDGFVLSALGLGVFFLMAEKDTEIAGRLARGEVSGSTTTYGNITIGDHQWAIVGGRFVLYLLIMLVVTALYWWVLVGRTGWTPGKLMTGIRVVRADGNAPGFGSAVVRWFLWIADGFPYFIPALVGFIVAMTNDRRQRLGDKAASTYVVRAGAMGSPVAGAPAESPAAVAGLAPETPAAAEPPPLAPDR